MHELAITVIGPDRTGIVADVAEALAEVGANLTDSTMTRLRGHFAMTLICTGPTAPEAEKALEALAGVTTAVRQVEPEASPGDDGEAWVVSVHGADRLGIVAAVTREVAGAGGNITDLSTRLVGSLYVLIAEADLPVGAGEELAQHLAVAASELGVEVTLRRAESEIL
ncbi:glycine cleavage system protein R [Paractinoplanes durhamensis]|uniref:Amino acid-binding protein n=1 Tax=Paractinoplanes durhamensis TaxID=113563 RepID=A0ABQ3Z7M8_9ACTN|nr:ACT domain-containing protein [Actinoplanes durhamensis]GIE05821.1 amino acid-binding protein [Actinoplanes durhamensis]